MANLEEAYNALRNAHNAGDTKAASEIAIIINKMQASPQQEKDPLAGDDSALRRVSDVGIDLTKGVLGVVDAATGLLDIPTGGAVGKFTDEVSESLFGGTTEDAKAFLDKGTSRQGLRAEREVAEAEGFGGTLSAMVQNPSTIIGTVAESLPAMFGGAKIAQGLVKLKKFQTLNKTGKAGRPGKTPNYALAAGVGEGTVGAGMQATDIRRQTDDQTLSAGQSGLAALTGVFTGVLGVFGATIAKKAGLIDPDVMFAEGIKEGTKRGMINNAIRSGLAEGALEELPQSIQEQVLQNIALGKDPLEGWGEAAATGLLAGFGMGSMATIASNAKRREIYEDNKRDIPKGEPEVGSSEPSKVPILSDPQATPQITPQVTPKAKPKAIEQVDDYEQNKLPDETEQQFYMRRNEEKTKAENQGENVNEKIQITAEEGGGAPLAQESKFFPITPTIAPRVGGGSNVSESGGLDAAGAQTPVATDGGGLAESAGIAGGPVATKSDKQSALEIKKANTALKKAQIEAEKKINTKEIDAINSRKFNLRKAEATKFAVEQGLDVQPFEISGSRYSASTPLQTIVQSKVKKGSKGVEAEVETTESEYTTDREVIKQNAIKDAAYVIGMQKFDEMDITAAENQIKEYKTKVVKKLKKERQSKLNQIKRESKLKGTSAVEKLNKDFPYLELKEGSFPTAFATGPNSQTYTNAIEAIYVSQLGKKNLIGNPLKDLKAANEYLDFVGRTPEIEEQISTNQKEATEQLAISKLMKRRVLRDPNLTARKETDESLEQEDIQEVTKEIKKDIENEMGVSQRDIESDKEAISRTKAKGNQRKSETKIKFDTFVKISDALLDGEGNPNPPINLKDILNIISSLSTVDGRIAQKLSNINSNTKIQAGKVKGNEAGQYDPKTNTITINIETILEQTVENIDAVNTVLHETMHSALDHIIDSTARHDYLIKKGKKITTGEKAELKVINDNLTESQRNSVKKLKTYQQKLRAYYKNTNQPLPDGLKAGQDLNEFIAYIFEGTTNRQSLGLGKSFQDVLSNLSQMEVGVKLENQSMLDRLQAIYKDLRDTIMGALGLNKNDNFSMLRAISTEVDIILNPKVYKPAVTEAAEDFGLTGKETRFKEGRKSVGVDADGTPVDRKWKIGKTKEEIAKFSTKKSGKSSVNKKEIKAKKLASENMSAKESMEKAESDAIKNRPNSKNVIKQIAEVDSTTIVEKMQNERRPLVDLDRNKERAGDLNFDGENINVIASLMDGIFGKADFYFKKYLLKNMDSLKRASGDFVKLQRKLDPKMDEAVAIERLSNYLIARHEQERRHVNFLKYAPVKTQEQIGKVLEYIDYKTGKKEAVSPSEYRRRIWNEIETNLELTMQDKKNLMGNLEYIVATYIDLKGESSKTGVGGPDGTLEGVEENNILYDTTANTFRTHEKRRELLNSNPELKKLVDNVAYFLDKVQKGTLELNKVDNYNTTLSQNMIDFYGWKNYVPLKGKALSKDENAEDEWGYSGERLGNTAREIAVGLEGRDSEASNVVTQTIVEAVQSTARAGREGLTKSIINNIKQGYLKGSVSNPISFQDRYKKIGKYSPGDLKENQLVHNNPDGSIEIITLDNPRIVKAIRKVANTANPRMDAVVGWFNKLTSWLGQLHTRYNPAFPFLNWTRDAITNFFVIAVDNPAALPTYVMELVKQTVKILPFIGSTNKAVTAYINGDISLLEKRAKQDGEGSVAADFLDFFERGGNVSYIQSMSLTNSIQDIMDRANKGPGGIILSSREEINSFFDKFVGTFELSVRLAAYRAMKGQRKNLNMTEEGVKDYAAMYAKNLANFEQTGEWGKQIGALFMFFRPSATGAVRALDAISPALRSLSRPLGSGGKRVMEERIPDEIKNDPKKLEAWNKEYDRAVFNGKVVIIASIGFGAAMYNLSKLLAGDDEDKRNIIDADNMSRWTRFARFDLGDGNIIQIPWGFGLGGLASIGAQLAAMEGSTYNDTSKIIRNISEILLDSFLPIPISRIDYTESAQNAGLFLADTLFPSALRPFMEMLTNTSGFGYQIYQETNRYGQAYAGGDNVPQMYKDAAMWLSDATGKESDLSPNGLYFFSNNYFDGPGRLLHNIYEADLILKNKQIKNINTVTKATMVLDSFISTKTEIISEDFQKTKNKLNNEFKKLASYKLDADKGKPGLSEYLAKPENASIELAETTWNQQIAGDLQNLQSELNALRVASEIPLKIRNQKIKNKKFEVLRKKIEILLIMDSLVPSYVPDQGRDDEQGRAPLN